MPSRISTLTARLPLADAVAQHGAPRVLLVAAFHVAALTVVAWTEVDVVGRALFFLAWGLINFCWLVLLRRAGLAALLSLAMILVLIALSRFKSDNLWMTVSFIDLMIIDADTIAFLLQVSGVKVAADYGAHFRSFDGASRSFIVEGAGGSTWYAEYNVLTGLSTRSYGRFAYFVTHIAAGRVERGLPQALRRCGYRTFTLYPVFGAFLSARSFQRSTGVERFIDSTEMRAKDLEPDRFYYDKALRLIGRERGAAPLFLFVYLTANHFPWDYPFRAELTPNWRGPGNAPEVDEYIRRQTLSVRDYGEFVARLKREFPDESFLLVRFGDHQPNFAARMLSPALDTVIRRRIMAHDPRYFTTYYALDAVNFRPVDLSSALEKLEAPYLPLVVQEAAGLPLDPSFREQKRILQRCGGAFYSCAGGAEARHFNRLLIDAGLIKRL